MSQDILGRDVLCANTDTKRARDLKRALYAKDSQAVWFLRGGYGSIRLVPELLKWKKPAHKKIVIGLSDISTLHLMLNQTWGWPTIHGPLLDRFAHGKVLPRWSKEMHAVVFGEQSEIVFGGLKALNSLAKRRLEIKAPVVGGNLITLQSSIGSPIELSGKGRILFFEELGERGYRIDRALEHLRQTGAFTGCKAIIFGDFLGGDEPKGGNKVKAVLKRFAGEVGLPVFTGLKSGHGIVQRPIPFLVPARLSAAAGEAMLVCPTGIQKS